MSTNKSPVAGLSRRIPLTIQPNDIHSHHISDELRPLPPQFNPVGFMSILIHLIRITYLCSRQKFKVPARMFGSRHHVCPSSTIVKAAANSPQLPPCQDFDEQNKINTKTPLCRLSFIFLLVAVQTTHNPTPKHHTHTNTRSIHQPWPTPTTTTTRIYPIPR